MAIEGFGIGRSVTGVKPLDGNVDTEHYCDGENQQIVHTPTYRYISMIASPAAFRQTVAGPSPGSSAENYRSTWRLVTWDLGIPCGAVR